MQLNFNSVLNNLGYGIVGLNILKNLVNTNINVSLWPIGQVDVTEENHSLVANCINKQKIFNPFAPYLKNFHEFYSAERLGKGTYGLLTFFEINKLDDYRKSHLSCPDIIFCPCHWLEEVIKSNGIKTKTVVCPMGVDTSIFYPKPLQTDGITRFFIVSKYEVRKGFVELCDAFNKAFGLNDRVELYINGDNPFFSQDENEAWENVFRKSKLGNKVKFTHRNNNHGAISDLINFCDCAVIPSKAEAMLLPGLETLACGRYLITTNYSAMPTYCTKENSMLVDIDKLELAFDGRWFDGSAEWASYGEAQIDQLIHYMRKIHADKQSGSLGLNTAGVTTAKQFSWKKCVDIITKNLL